MADSAPGPMPPLVSNPAENDTARIVGALSVLTVLTLAIVVARVYVRMVIIRNMGWDDGIMIFTMALSLSGAGVALASCRYGAGKHAGDIAPNDLMTGLRLNFISQPIYMVAIATVKLSVGASLLRIASTKFYRILILSIMGFIVVYTTGFFITMFTQCTDIRVQWDPSVQSVCYSQHTLQSLSYTSAALNILTDLLFAVFIPAPMLWNLNVNRRTRITLIAILSLGVFACAAAFVKLGFIIDYGKLGDFLWDSRNITIWTAAEVNTGISAGSMPALRPLFKRILGSTYGRGSRKTPASGTNYQSHGHSSKSGNQWRTLSSGRKGDLDDASSQRVIHDPQMQSGYELDRVSGSSEGRMKTTILSASSSLKSRNSDEMLPEEIHPNHAGIRATTVTRVEIEPSGSSK